MENTVFYVALSGSFDFMNPTIVEKFDCKSDADSYAALMSRTKQRKYEVLSVVTIMDGTPQEK